MNSLKVYLRCFTDDEYFDETPNAVCLELDKTYYFERIQLMAKLAAENKFNEILDWYYQYETLDFTYDDEGLAISSDLRTEGSCLKVDGESINLDCYVKHTNVRLFTSHVSIKSVDEAFAKGIPFIFDSSFEDIEVNNIKALHNVAA